MKCNSLVCSKIAALAVSIIVFSIVAGCGGGGGGGGSTPIADISSPVVSEQSVTTVPANLTFMGGEATLEAKVIDNVRLDKVEAVIALGGVKLATQTMTLKSGNTYTVKYPVGPNVTGAMQVYQVKVRATDTSNNISNSIEFTFNVPAAGGGLPDPGL